MIDSNLITLVLVIVASLAFDYINGFHDAANAIATVVSTKVLSPRIAVFFGAFFNLVGALMSTEVAVTIGKGLVDSHAITMPIILCALLGGIIWNLITWRYGIPSSSSHALIGSLLGATFFSSALGYTHIKWDAVYQKVFIPMVTSPLLGFFIGYLVICILIWAIHKMNLYKINSIFGKLQIVSAGVMALSHGSNDAQKSMGIIALALLTFSQTTQYHLPIWLIPSGSNFHVPLWVILSCALMMALGTLNGGWKIIHTLGNKMIKLQPIHGFAAETTSSLMILIASKFGIPLSTTHVITTSIMGVGASKRLNAVKWSVVQNILWAWVLTIPVTFILSGVLTYFIR